MGPNYQIGDIIVPSLSTAFLVLCLYFITAQPNLSTAVSIAVNTAVSTVVGTAFITVVTTAATTVVNTASHPEGSISPAIDAES